MLPNAILYLNFHEKDAVIDAHLLIHEGTLYAVSGDVLWVDETEQLEEQLPFLRHSLAQVLHGLCLDSAHNRYVLWMITCGRWHTCNECLQKRLHT